MCAWLEGDALFLEIKACNARPVRAPLAPAPLPPPARATLILAPYDVFFFFFSVMRRANVELHGTLIKARKEVKRTRSKLVEVVTKQGEKSKLALNRLKVRDIRIF